MPSRSRWLPAVVATALVATLAAGCSSSADPARDTLVVAEDQVPPNLNVLLASGATASAQRVLSNVLQNLLTADERGRFVPQLAVRVPRGADVRSGPLRVTFRIRPAARWSDGRPVTSADVVFTWRTMMDPKIQIASRSGWDQIVAIRPGVTASGGPCPPLRCFTVFFRGDYAPWREVFSVSGGYYVLPRHALQGRDFNTVWSRGDVLGSGPFKLESYEPRVRAVLVRDPDYWGPGPARGRPVERIVFNFLHSPGAALAALREGEAQLISPPPDPSLLARARDVAGATVISVPSTFFEHIVINTQAPPLDDPAVRRALAYSIDRVQIAQVLLAGTAPVLDSMLRPFQLGYRGSFARYRYAPARARALLAGAGWRPGPDGVLTKGGRRLSFSLILPSDSELRRSVARLIAAQARRAGFDVEPRPLPADRIFGAILSHGDFSAVMAAFGGGVDPSLTALLDSSQISTATNQYTGQNAYRWSSPEADRLLRLSDRQLDDRARAATLRRLQDLLADQVPFIPLYQQPNTVAYTAPLRGVRENPTQAEVFWNSGTWSLGD